MSAFDSDMEEINLKILSSLSEKGRSQQALVKDYLHVRSIVFHLTCAKAEVEQAISHINLLSKKKREGILRLLGVDFTPRSITSLTVERIIEITSKFMRDTEGS